MDRNGWEKTKTGMVHYKRKRHMMTKKDFRRIAEHWLSEDDYIPEDSILDWFDVVADIFSTVVVDRFRSIPGVSQFWEVLRAITFEQHRAGRPLSLVEELRVVARLLRNSEKTMKGGVSPEIDFLVNDAIAGLIEDMGGPQWPKQVSEETNSQTSP